MLTMVVPGLGHHTLNVPLWKSVPYFTFDIPERSDAMALCMTDVNALCLAAFSIAKRGKSPND